MKKMELLFLRKLSLPGNHLLWGKLLISLVLALLGVTKKQYMIMED